MGDRRRSRRHVRRGRPQIPTFPKNELARAVPQIYLDRARYSEPMPGKHSVHDFADDLSVKLAARSRRVSVFLGAGSSCASGLPGMEQLTQIIVDGLSCEEQSTFRRLQNGRDLETTISRLRKISALLEDSSEAIDGITGAEATLLDTKIQQLIVRALTPEDPNSQPGVRLGTWAAQSQYHNPIEIFTVNYDLLIEAGLESCGVPYFDGFVGNGRGRFRSDLVDAEPGGTGWIPSFFVRLWKLHGSVNWLNEPSTAYGIVRLGQAVADAQPAAIYPSDAKYEESRRVPFSVLQDRFRKTLQSKDTLLLICGYSFGDQHLNEMIFDAALRQPLSEFIAFCYDEIPDSLAERAQAVPNLQAVGANQAILRTRMADWSAPDAVAPELWSDQKFGLGNFANLTTFLARGTDHNRGDAPPLSELDSADDN